MGRSPGGRLPTERADVNAGGAGEGLLARAAGWFPPKHHFCKKFRFVFSSRSSAETLPHPDQNSNSPARAPTEPTEISVVSVRGTAGVSSMFDVVRFKDCSVSRTSRRPEGTIGWLSL